MTISSFKIFASCLLLLVSIGCRDQKKQPNKNLSDVKRMVLETTLSKRLPHGKGLIGDQMIREHLKDRARYVKEQREDAFIQWNSKGLSSEEYGNALQVILEDMEINKSQWLTLGNIIELIGFPNTISQNDYFADMEGNVQKNTELFEVKFDKKNIELKFSASGFLMSVLSFKDGAYSGSVPLHWPQNYTYASELPIISGRFCRNNERIQDRLNVLKQVSFEKLEQKVNEINSRKDEAFKFSLILIDGIANELAQVYYTIGNNQSIYHSFQWYHYDGNYWEILPENEVQLYFQKLH